MGDDHVIAIAQSLGGQLTSLDVKVNRFYHIFPPITQAGVRALCQMSKLEHLQFPGQ